MPGLFDFQFSSRTGDRGMSNLFKLLRGATGKVKVGIVGAKGQAQVKRRITTKEGAKGEARDVPSVAEVAARHELGIGVDKRPWLSGWLTQNDTMIKLDIRKAIDLIAQGRLTPDQALKVLGVKWVASIQDYIRASENFKPNADSTIAKKGSSSPLIDTAQMLTSVSFEVIP